MPVHDHDSERMLRRDAAIRARQRSRSIATGIVLAGLAVLFFAISIAKMM